MLRAPMKFLRILFASSLLAAAACDTTPDDPLGHYSYATPLHDLLPLFASWDEPWQCAEIDDEPGDPIASDDARSSCMLALRD
jgi:hypothetical protein